MIGNLFVRKIAGVSAIVLLTAVMPVPGGGLRAQSPARDTSAATAAAEVDVPLVFDGKPTTRSKIEAKLSPSVREALDRWAEPAERLDLRIALGKRSEHIVLAHAPDDTLTQAAAWLDAAFDILDPLVPLAGERTAKAMVAILVDEEYVQSGSWFEFLSELQLQRLLVDEAAEHLRSSPEGLMLRQASVFLQPTWDIAGNAAAGDDEFRLGNSVVHMYAHCFVTHRVGQQPASLLWGLGYVVELKLFQTAYHFNVEGFVPTSSHSNWGTEAQLFLEKHLKDEQFSLSALAANDKVAGQAKPPQILTWAGLAYLSQKQPQAVRDLFLALATIQSEAGSPATAQSYTGDPLKTAAALEATFDAIALKDLNGWLKTATKKQQKKK